MHDFKGLGLSMRVLNFIIILKDRIGSNEYLQIVLLGMLGMAAGGIVFLAYLVLLLPQIGRNPAGLIPILSATAALGLVMFLLINFRRTLPIVTFFLKQSRGSTIDEQLWLDVRKSVLGQPQATALTLFLLWPSASMSIALMEYLLRNLDLEQALLLALSGWIIGPVTALALFFSMRRVARGFLQCLDQFSFTHVEVPVRMWSIRRKLAGGFLILSICPMVFAVLIDRAQGRAALAGDRMDQVLVQFQDIHEAYMEQVAKQATPAWQSAIASVPSLQCIREPGIMLIDLEGRAILNPPPDGSELERALSRPLAWWRPIQGKSLLADSGHYLVYREFSSERVYLMAVMNPFAPPSSWLKRNALTLVLLLLLGGMGMGLGLLVAEDTSEPIRNLSEASRKLSQGQFVPGRAFLPDDELGLLGKTFNQMIELLADQVHRNEQINQSIHQTLAVLTRESEGVLEQTSKQTMGMSEQSQFSQEAHQNSQEITDSARRIDDQARAIQEMAEQTMAASQQGQSVLADASRGIESISSEIFNIAGQMDVLSKNYASIETIVKMIDDISDRTEMLALNAALEAAGAGEYGRRFATVAQEIKQLVNRTNDSTSEIQVLVKTIRSSSLKSAQAIEDGKRAADQGIELMSKLASSYVNIAQAAGKTTDSVRGINKMTRQQTSSAEQLVMLISEVRRVSQVVGDSAHKTEHSMRELKHMASTLFEMSRTRTEESKDES